MDCSCTASVYWSPTTRSLLLTSLWWYTARHCWRFPSSPMESLPVERISLSNISNKPISSPLHLGMTEKSLFTELIMFENSHIRIRTLIFHLGRGRMNAFPIKLYGFQLHCSKESKLWKSFFSETRRELPFGFEPKTCWFVINRSIHLSYDSISRFLKSFNHFKLMGIKTNLKGNGIFTAHSARTWGVFLRTVKLRTPQGGFEPPSRFRPTISNTFMGLWLATGWIVIQLLACHQQNQS